jgi:hypothetical protein
MYFDDPRTPLEYKSQFPKKWLHIFLIDTDINPFNIERGSMNIVMTF